MEQNLPAKVDVVISASMDRVWEALTNPEMIKQYLFGTDTVTDWKEGSPIIWKGEWQGKAYVDKGEILKVVPGKFLQMTYWSGMSGLPDKPENYKIVTYELTKESERTKLTLTQDNNPTEADRLHSEQNWTMVLDGLKSLWRNK